LADENPLELARRSGKGLARMTFRFIHSSDWHIAKPFRRFEPALAGELAAARLDIVASIAKLARTKGARHVVVAGAVFDSELVATSEIRRALARLAEESDVTWLLLPGNHDPARIGGVWDQVARLGAPPNVVVLDKAMPHVIGSEAVILPAPLASKDPGRDLSDWMDTAATPAGIARIGLAHGSVRGFGSEDDAALRLAPDRAKRAGLSYLALGDWHGLARVTDETWYSGTPEPDQYPDNEPGFVLAVAVEGAKLVSVDKIASSAFTWRRLERAIHAAADLDAIGRDLERVSPSLGKTLVRLSLSGHLSLAERTALDAWRDEWSAKLRTLELDDKALTVKSDAADFAALGLSGPLLEAAERLAAIGADGNNPQHAAAATALLRLAGFAAEARREGTT
jgi:DNA repair exonuclease SbcCD nuclease subunit